MCEGRAAMFRMNVVVEVAVETREL